MEGLKEKSNPEMENKESSMYSDWGNAHVFLRRMRGKVKGGEGARRMERGREKRRSWLQLFLSTCKATAALTVKEQLFSGKNFK